MSLLLLLASTVLVQADVGDGKLSPPPQDFDYHYEQPAPPPQYYCPPTVPWWAIFIPVPQVSFYPSYGYGGYGYGHGYYAHPYYGHGRAYYNRGYGYHGGYYHGGGQGWSGHH